MSDEAQAASWIGGAVSAAAAAIVVLRKIWSSDSRKIQFDANATQWEKEQSEQLKELRKQHEAGWKRHVEDAQKIAELNGEIGLLNDRLGRQIEHSDRQDKRIAVLEADLKTANDDIDKMRRKP